MISILFIIVAIVIVYLLINNKIYKITQEDIIMSNNNGEDEKIIVEYEGNKYDITNFAIEHPGGKEVLIENNGKDVKEIMFEVGHSDNAFELFKKFKIE